MISSSGIHRAHGSQDVFDTLVTRAFGKLAGFTAFFFQPCWSVGVGRLKERSAGQIRLLLNCFGGKDCFNDFVSIRPDLAGPLAEPVTVPFLIMLMLFRHVIRDGTVLSFTATQTLMGSDTVLLVKDLDRRIRDPNIDFFPDESVWARVVHKVHSYVKCQARQNVKQRRDMLLSLYSHSCFLYILSSILWFTKQPERRIL